MRTEPEQFWLLPLGRQADLVFHFAFDGSQINSILSFDLSGTQIAYEICYFYGVTPLNPQHDEHCFTLKIKCESVLKEGFSHNEMCVNICASYINLRILSYCVSLIVNISIFFFIYVCFILSFYFSFPLYIYIYIIIIIIMSCRQHGYPWPSLATSSYHSSPLAGLQSYILCPHIAVVCKFGLVVLLLLGHMWGSIGVHYWRARPCFSSSVRRVWLV